MGNARSTAKAKPEAAPAAGAATPYRLEDQVGHLLRRAHQRHTALFQTLIGDRQITTTQFAALVKLHDQGELSQNHLGRLTAMDPATIQGVSRRLAERDLIRSRKDAGDRRRTLLSLTPAGLDLARRLISNGPLVSDVTMEPLSREEQAVFLELLGRLI